MKSGDSLSIWFFVGLSLLVNGVLIFGTGVYELVYPPTNKVVLYQSARQHLVGSDPCCAWSLFLLPVCAGARTSAALAAPMS